MSRFGDPGLAERANCGALLLSARYVRRRVGPVPLSVRISSRPPAARKDRMTRRGLFAPALALFASAC